MTVRWRLPTEAWLDMHREYWSALSNDYEKLYRDSWSRAEDSQSARELAAALNGVSGKILDLACGTGFGYNAVAPLILDAETRYVGIDISSAMIDVARRRHPSAEFFVLPMEDCASLGPEAFELVMILNGSFSFTSDPRQTLEGVREILGIGGRFFVTCLGRYALRRLFRLTFSSAETYFTRGAEGLGVGVPAYTFGPKEMRELLEATGFRVRGIVGQSALGGVAQWSRLIPSDRMLCRALPGLAHSLIIYAERVS